MLESQHTKRFKKIVANILLFNNFFKAAQKIQFLSEFEAGRSIGNYEYYVCPNGVNIPKRKKEKFNKDKIKIVYIGRTEVYCKGIDLLIYAAKKIENRLKEANCTIDIYGPDLKGRHDEIKKLLIETQIGDIIKLHDAVTGTEKEEILLSADCFIQASRHEGMPLGVLEALSYGMPCIVTEGTNMADVIRKIDAGWTCETDINSLSCALLKMIKEKELLPFKTRNSSEFIKENFSCEKVAKETIDNYEPITRK